MGFVNQSLPVKAPSWANLSVPTRESYDFWDVLSAASNLTATGIGFANITDAGFNQEARNYFSNSLSYSGDFVKDDNYWKSIRREAVLEYIPVMDKEREVLNQARLTPREVRYLLDSENFKEFSKRTNEVDRIAFSHAVVNSRPGAVLTSAMALSMFEPWNIGSWPLAAVKAGSRAASAARLAAINASITAGEEYVISRHDPNRTIGESLVTIGLASAISGAIGAKLSSTKSIQLKQTKEIEAHLKSIDKESDVVIDVDNLIAGDVAETVNLNLIDSARELNSVLNEVEGVGAKTAEKIIEIKNSLPGKAFTMIDDLVESDTITPSQKEKIKRLLDSGKLHLGSSQSPGQHDAIVGAYGVEKIASLSSPLVRLIRSPFAEIREAAQELLETPFLTTKNLKGIPTPTSLEQVMTKNRKLGNDLVEGIEESYYKYLYPEGTGGEFARSRAGRVFRQTGQLAKNIATVNLKLLRDNPVGMENKMSFDAFKQAVLQHHTGAIISNNPSIINAAKYISRFFSQEEKKVKTLLIGLDPQNQDWVTNQVYTHRLYNRAKIAENPDGFVEFLLDQATKKYGSLRNLEADFKAPKSEIEASFRKSVDNLVKAPEERIDLEKVFEPKKRSGSHNRYWNFIDDADLYKTDYVVKDIEAIANSYITSVLADADFFAKYGTVNTRKALDKIEKEILELHEDAFVSDPNLKISLQQDLDLMHSMMQRVRGVYLDKNSPVPGGQLQATIDNIKKYNNIRLGGAFAIKSIPDIGRSIMFLGMSKAYGPLFKSYLFRNKKALEMYKRSSRELKSINVANEVVFSSIISSMTNLSVNSFAKNKFTDVLNKNHNAFFVLNGLAMWNQMMKTNAGIGVLDQIVENSRLAASGKLSKKKLANMAKLGLDEDSMRMLLREHDAHGASYQGIHLMNFENWSEEALKRPAGGLSLADKVQLAIKKEVDTIIVTPGVGDAPLIMENSWASLLLQYKSFPIAAVVRQTLPFAQNPDSNAFLGLLVSTSAAFAAGQFVAYAAGQDYSEDSWSQLLWDSLAGTGNLSTIGEFSNYMQNISSGNPAVFGPSASIIPDFTKAVSGLSNEEGMNPYEERAAARLLPYAGLMRYISLLPLEAAEAITE